MLKKKGKERLKLCLKLNSNTIERRDNESPEEYISRVFQMAHKEHDEHFFVSIDRVLANSHIQYINDTLVNHNFINTNFDFLKSCFTIRLII